MPRDLEDLEAELDKLFGATAEPEGDLEAELDKLFSAQPEPEPTPAPIAEPASTNDKKARQDAFAKKLAALGIGHRQLVSGSVQAAEPKGQGFGSTLAIAAGGALDDAMSLLTAGLKTRQVGGKSVPAISSPYLPPTPRDDKTKLRQILDTLEDTAVSKRVESALRVPAAIPMGAGSAALGVLSGHPIQGLLGGASRAATDLVSGAVGAVSPSASAGLEEALGVAGQPGGGELFAERYGMDPEAAHGLEAIAGLVAAGVVGGAARQRKAAKARAKLLEEFPPDLLEDAQPAAPSGKGEPPKPPPPPLPSGPPGALGGLPERIGGRLLKKFDMTGDAQVAFADAARQAGDWMDPRRNPVSGGGPGVSWEQTAAEAMNLLERYGADPKAIFEKDLQFPELAARSRALAEVAVAAGREVTEANAAFKANPLDPATQARLATASVRLPAVLEPAVVASTELGRGLQHLKAMTGELSRTKQYAEIVKRAGGITKLETLSKMLDTMPDDAARSRLLKRFAPLRSAEEWWTAWTSNMLTSIQTHVVNPAGSMTGGAIDLLDTLSAASVGVLETGVAKARGKAAPDVVRFREIVPKARGVAKAAMFPANAAVGGTDFLASKLGVDLAKALPSLMAPIESFRRSNRVMAESWKTGVDIFGDIRSEHATADVLGRRRGPLEEFGKSVGLQGAELEKFVKAAMPSMKARVASGDFIGLRLVAMEDAWFKSIYRGAAYESLLTREGMNVHGLRGDALKQYVADGLTKDPTTIKLRSGETLEAASKEHARYLTFSDVSPGARLYRSWEREADRRGHKLIAATMRVIAPFTNTPFRLANHVIQHAWQGPVPLAAITPKFWRGVREGGVARQQALGKIAFGGVAAAYFANQALQGKITGSGPRDPGQRFLLQSLGWQAYSRRVGKEWVSYSRFDPLAGQIGLAADYAEMMAESPDLKADDIAGRIAFSFARNLTSKVYLQGVSRAVELLDLEDPSFLNRAGRFAGGNVGTLVPGIVGSAAREMDPFVRDTRGVIAQIKNRIPFWRETLQRKIDAKGVPFTHQNFGPDFLSPVYISAIIDDPFANEVFRLSKMGVKLGFLPPERTIQLSDEEGGKSSYTLSDEEYEQMSMAVGAAIHAAGIEAVLDPEWAGLPVEDKAEKIRDIASQKRDEGRDAMRQMLPMPQPSTAPVRY